MKNKQEKEESLMVMNPSSLEDKGKAYFENMHDQVWPRRRSTLSLPTSWV
jgi:hypothetical protein